MRKTARNAAVQALLQVTENEGYSNIVLDKVLRATQLEPRDSALTSTIFYGVLENRLTLDFYLANCLREPDKKLDAEVEAILHTAAYQILYLDKIPDSAAVNEAVEMAREWKKSSSAGFVNAVLRTLLRKKDGLKLPAGMDAPSLSIRYSVPEGLIALWENSYGRENTHRILEAFQEKPELYIRVNRLKVTPGELAESLKNAGISVYPSDLSTDTLILENCGTPTSLPQFQEGLFHVQDLSAQLVCELMAPQPGEHICDCCAAPGGKTFTIAELMGNRGNVTSLDLYKGRVKLIQAGAERLGLTCVDTRVNDAQKGFDGIPAADRVLCDVPCSGYGVIRRKPEIRYKDVSTIAELPKIQYEILERASGLVKAGGLLVYATCTLNPAENGEVARRFLENNGDFEPFAIQLPPAVTRAVEEPGNMLTMMPFAGGSDGFFTAIFRKKQT